jgi:DNA-binding GntR family transcriptional regulator
MKLSTIDKTRYAENGTDRLPARMRRREDRGMRIRTGKPQPVNPSQPAPPRSIPEQVAEQIGAAIIDGRHRPGDRLIETELAAGFGVSRGPIREALRILERRHLIEIQPRRGAYVRAVSLNSIADLFNARMALSGLAAQLMAQLRPLGYLETLRRRIEELRAMASRRDADPLAFAYVVTRAVRAIVRGSDNALLVDLMGNLADQTVWTTIWKTPLDYLTASSRRESVRRLALVLEAIEAGDGASAERELRSFLEDDRDHAIRVLGRLRGEKVDGFRLLHAHPPGGGGRAGTAKKKETKA